MTGKRLWSNRLAINVALVVFLMKIQTLKSQRTPSKKLLQEEEVCISQSTQARQKRDSWPSEKKYRHVHLLSSSPKFDNFRKKRNSHSDIKTRVMTPNVPQIRSPPHHRRIKRNSHSIRSSSSFVHASKLTGRHLGNPGQDGKPIISECPENNTSAGNVKSPTILTTTENSAGSTRNTTRKAAKNTNTATSHQEFDICSLHNTTKPSGICECRKVHCGYNVGANQCQDHEAMCRKYRFSPTECVRFPIDGLAEVFYIYAGVICPFSNEFKESSGASSTRSYRSCNIDETVLAVNLGRNESHGDGYGIQYKADNQVPYRDLHKTRKVDMSLSLTGVDMEDQGLYKFQIWGDSSKANTGGCTAYTVPLNRDGEYEMSLKMVDNYWKRQGTRGFNLQFNGVTILVEIDVIAASHQQYKAVDFVLKFEVRKQASLLVMPGYPESKIVKGTVDLSFCFGKCSTADENYHVAGFSVVRFVSEPELKSGSACYQFRMLPCLCARNGCFYNAEKGDCRRSGGGASHKKPK